MLYGFGESSVGARLSASCHQPGGKVRASTEYLAVDDLATVGMEHLSRHTGGVVRREKDKAWGHLGGSPTRFIDTSPPKFSTLSGGKVEGINAVQMGPGATAFTRIPRSATAFESERVKATIAPLVAE